MPVKKPLWIELEYGVRDLFLSPSDPERGVEYPLHAEYAGSPEIVVKIRPMTDEEAGKGYDASDAVATAWGEFRASQRVYEMFESLSRRELPAGSVPDPDAGYWDKSANQMRAGAAIPAGVCASSAAMRKGTGPAERCTS